MQNNLHRSLTMQPHLPALVAAPVRQSLRGLRDVLHLGRDFVHEVIEHSPLPPPVSQVAANVLAEVDRVAERVEGVAANLARGVLGENIPTAKVVHSAEGPDDRFAEVLGLALKKALAQLGAPRATVDGVAIAHIHAAFRKPAALGLDPDSAARLARLLLHEALRVNDAVEAELLPVAAFAALLWLLSDRERDPATLEASTDLAAALAPEIRQSLTDEAGLARLLAEFQDHV